MTDNTRATRHGLIVAVLALAGVIAAGMQTLVIPLIGQLPTILHTTATNTSWAVTATLSPRLWPSPSPGASVTCTASGGC
jgi:energy-converting hydrogenase Eha subunit A